MNGGLNLSIADGWWIEGHNGKNGWTFGSGQENRDHEAADSEDAASLYRLLQDEIVPLYYERDAQGIPHGWITMMKEAITSSIYDFSSTAWSRTTQTRPTSQPAAESVVWSGTDQTTLSAAVSAVRYQGRSQLPHGSGAHTRPGRGRRCGRAPAELLHQGRP